jgi:hypothetical protein
MSVNYVHHVHVVEDVFNRTLQRLPNILQQPAAYKCFKTVEAALHKYCIAVANILGIAVQVYWLEIGRDEIALDIPQLHALLH